MCFSPEASFAVGAVLIPAGVYCIAHAVRKSSAYLPLAAVPLFFSAQQFCEGFVWLGLQREDTNLTRQASLTFLFFGLLFWLVWIPLSVVFLEKRRRIKILLGVIALIGWAGGLVLYLPLVWNSELLSTIVIHHSIRYKFDSAPPFTMFSRELWQVFYFAVVATPIAVTKAQGFGGFGIMLLVSALVSQIFFWHAFVSVWCFFAAALSIYLCGFFRQLTIADIKKLPPVLT